MKRLIVTVLVLLAIDASAKSASKIWQEFESFYPPAEKHAALVSAHEQLDLSKVKSYVVILRGGIPAERAEFYISWGDYDYRGATIDGDKLTTRRGSPYTFLEKGDVMAVADIDHLGRTLYLKLISPDIYVPKNRTEERHHSRVTVMLGIKLPKEVLKADDASKAMEVVGDWAKPFNNLDDAKLFAASLR